MLTDLIHDDKQVLISWLLPLMLNVHLEHVPQIDIKHRG